MSATCDVGLVWGCLHTLVGSCPTKPWVAMTGSNTFNIFHMFQGLVNSECPEYMNYIELSLIPFLFGRLHNDR